MSEAERSSLGIWTLQETERRSGDGGEGAGAKRTGAEGRGVRRLLFRREHVHSGEAESVRENRRLRPECRLQTGVSREMESSRFRARWLFGLSQSPTDD
eukprot:853872-Rhodomonas_salina.2